MASLLSNAKDCHLSVTAILYKRPLKGQRSGFADNGGCTMTQHKTSYLAAVLVSLCITFVPGGTNGCTGERCRGYFVWIKDSSIYVRLVRNDGYLHGYSTYHRCILVLFVH